MPTKSSKKSNPLSKDSVEILIAEYNYIAGTANQANDDRSRISSFYLIAVGSLLAALASAKFLSETFDPGITNIIFSGLFFLLTLLGTTTIIQLTRLRVAWFESILAMNHIKEFMIAKDEELATAFKWRYKTLPKFYKPNSIAFLQTAEVAFISALAFGAGVFFFPKNAQYNTSTINWTGAVLSGVIVLSLQIVNYRRLLNLEQKRLQKELENNNAA